MGPLSRLRRAGSLAAALGLAVLVGCGSGDDGDDGAAGEETTTTSSVGQTTGPAPSTATSAAPTTATSAPSSSLVLRADGFGSVKLGDRADKVIEAAHGFAGQPERDDPNAGCESGADRVVAWAGLVAVFDNGRWVGYSFDDALVPAATAEGIKIGSTVAELRSAYPKVEIMETSVGFEWFVELTRTTTLRGFATGLDPDDPVVSVGAGDNCIFR